MRYPTIVLAALAALLSPAAAFAQDSAKPGQGMMMFKDSDPEMNAAMDRARRELPDFFAHLAKPGPTEGGFMVKYDLVPEPEGAEFIWAEVIGREDGVITAVLANFPADQRFHRGQRVQIRDEQIVDWSYVRDGVLQGSYSSRVMIDRMPPDQAAEYRRQYGW